MNSYISKTEEIPAYGGTWKEGAVGQPVFLNPIISTSDVDQDINKLIFGNLDVLSDSIKSDGLSREWTLRLKNNLKWSDGENITSDDIIFSIDTALDPNSHSPLISDFSGITATRISELEIKFTLPSGFVFFGDTLKKFQPIPKHIFENIPAANFALSNFVKEPIGSGPYSFKDYNKDRTGFITEYDLGENPLFSGNSPYIKKIVFNFYNSEDDLIKAYNNGLVDGFPLNDLSLLPKILIRHDIQRLSSNRYYAVFLNPNRINNFQLTSIRKSLSENTPRDLIISSVFKDFAEPAYSPIRSEVESDLNNNSTLNNLTFSLIYPNVKNLELVANLLKNQWESAGGKIILKEERTEDIQGTIKDRSYDALLFGNILNNPEDFYSLWHSSRQSYPGLNLSFFSNKEADSLMERIRLEDDRDKRKSMVDRLNSIIMRESPAIFIAYPDYLYVTVNRLKGFSAKNIVTESDRLNSLPEWYLGTTRRFR